MIFVCRKFFFSTNKLHLLSLNTWLVTAQQPLFPSYYIFFKKILFKKESNFCFLKLLPKLSTARKIFWEKSSKPRPPPFISPCNTGIFRDYNLKLGCLRCRQLVYNL